MEANKPIDRFLVLSAKYLGLAAAVHQTAKAQAQVPGHGPQRDVPRLPAAGNDRPLCCACFE
ncbi:MAG: hypothetical protein AB1768_11190 [Pseudomonadota bacterium]